MALEKECNELLNLLSEAYLSYFVDSFTETYDRNTFKNIIAILRTDGLIIVSEDGELVITDLGRVCVLKGGYRSQVGYQ